MAELEVVVTAVVEAAAGERELVWLVTGVDVGEDVEVEGVGITTDNAFVVKSFSSLSV